MAIIPKRTIKDMTSPNLNQQPLCIEYPDLEVNFELKSSLIHLLPNFRGLVERHQHVKACGICTSLEHVTEMCPTFQEQPVEHVDTIRGFFGQQQKRYDPFSNTYNLGWKDHPNLSYSAQSQNFQRPQYNHLCCYLHPIPNKLASSVSKLESQERFTKSKKEEEEKEIFETFCKVEVNIPLLDAIKQIPHYAKFLKNYAPTKVSKRKRMDTFNGEDHMMFAREENLTPMLAKILEEDMVVDPNISENVFELEALPSLPLHLAFIELPQFRTKLLPSILQTPTLELKELPKYLKYAYLGENNTLSPLDRPSLTSKGLSPSTCMHRILLEDGTKPSREAQCRLNPPMMEVVKKKILKLLDAGFHQILVAPADQDKTKFTCPFGTFDYRRMSFGLGNGPLPLKMYDASFEFDDACAQAFNKLKESLASAPVIRPPDWSQPFEIMCDINNHAIGVVVGQKIGTDPHVIYYASRMLDVT
ncbi:UNVERIFIED_CONTAM: hypothetical protein Scaly_2560500 [Sesamum calycinum]|uniref:Reverse transcriptase/retrotransposon-derived protein RNase H-like domain-containing protein n=1 Tax=Sesamum calycinum TaxID=2727403 RepID=A0AAW2KN80_9LAMI